MLEHKNGLINILFHKEPQNENKNHRNNMRKSFEDFKFNRVQQDAIFSMRSRSKQIRFMRFSEKVHFGIEPGRGMVRKMIVNGNTIKDVKPIKHQRVLYSQGIKRSIDFTNNASQQSSAKRQYETIQNSSRHSQTTRAGLRENYVSNQIYEGYCRISLNKQTMKYEDDIQSSTEASSPYKNSHFTIRQRKVDKKNFIKQQSPQNKKIDKNNLMNLKKEIFKLYSNPQLSPDNITAKSFVIFQHFQDRHKNKPTTSHSILHTAFNSKINLQVASLTKIMTFLVAVQICQKYNIDIKNTYKSIGNFQSKIEGTSAELSSGEMYSIEALLYGLMLPSGNDASIALSVFCGETLQKNNTRRDGIELNTDKAYFYRKFILEMNKKCYELGMKRTVYSNSHGLANSMNKGCASDLIVLIDHALRKPIFRQIIKSTQYTINVQVTKKGSISTNNYKQVMWQNTHELLKKMPQVYKGIKTGTTEAAGNCLASLLQLKGRQFVIIVLNSKSNKSRYRDTERLRTWLEEKQFKSKQ